MSTVFAALGPFGDAIDFIFHQRESQAGTVQVGGLGEIWELTWMHIKLSFAATAIATLVALPIGVWLGHIGQLPVPGHQHLEHRPRRARRSA